MSSLPRTTDFSRMTLSSNLWSNDYQGLRLRFPQKAVISAMLISMKATEQNHQLAVHEGNLGS